MKRTSLAIAVAIVLVLSGAVGCSKEKERRSSTPVAASSTPVPERLTPDVAARAFRTYLTNDDVARASGDERLALTWVTDGQSPLTAAEYRKAAFGDNPVPRYDYLAPALYVPKLNDSTYPQWFVAVAERTQKPAAGGRPDAKTRQTSVQALTRKAPGAPWRLSLATVLVRKAKLPRIAVDSEGYATPLATTDAALVIPPKSIPGIQAAIAEEGPDSVPAKLMKPGPGTTGYYEQTRKAKKRARDAGLAFDAVFPATQFPIFPLCTEDGAGFVLYALGRDTVTVLRNKKRKVPVPRDAAHLLDSLIIGDQLHVSQILQFGVSDPVKATGKKPQPKADVIAIDGGATKASAPDEKTP